ncbi:pkinase-domain-containing protein [Phaffia rhodozyma]|uniref:Pkinase-domain-containing protein n=1 Tax=Phaffia rhodozyma TaxID=264483 RepID=A0A0F7STQ3_PHARH|nr:pkinase-domain-containing protein [Phaffia rhodozyma]
MPVTRSTSYVPIRSGSNLTSPTTMNNSIVGNHSQPQPQHHQYQQQYQNQNQKQQQSSTTPTSPDFLTPTSSVSSSSSPSASSPFRRTYANQPPLPTTSTAARSTAVVPISSTVSVLQWKEPEIADFLHSIKCGHLIRTFEAHDITGSVILELVDVALLKEMGIDRQAQAKKRIEQGRE